ncbi:MAG: nucleotidyl transferase AbiEii/AbiGii toxin family protein [Desulfovibrionales bacterium]
MKDSPYFNQVRLILRVMPYITAEERFALKGGTAINLFIRDMLRLSIDIDLVWLPLESRDASLDNISSALNRISDSIRNKISGITVRENRLQGTNHIVRLAIGSPGAMIKIEPNLVIRGTVFFCETRDLCKVAEELFELKITANTASMADLYGGKLCAALDRQHPRDIFDIKVLMENEGITEEIRAAFIIYLASHGRPMNELLDPNRVDFRSAYEKEFAGMTLRHVDYQELVSDRERIIHTVNQSLTENERNFLISIKQGRPDWQLLPISGLDRLPAVQWKLMNIQKMSKAKHMQSIEKLKKVLGL